jgi:hypothetical protein
MKRNRCKVLYEFNNPINSNSRTFSYFCVEFLKATRLRPIALILLLFVIIVSSQAQLPFSEEHKSFVTTLEKSVIPVSIPIVIDTVEAWLKWETVENYTFGKDRGGLRMITDLNALHPYFRDQVSSLIAQCKAKGITLAVVETYRTPSKQNEYRSMGKKYTRSSGGYSKHQYGLAVDLVPIVNSKAEWHDPILWKKIGTIGERLGLRWGGRWRRPYDPGHFEWTGGLASLQLTQGVFPTVPEQDQYPCLEEDLKNLSVSWKAWETEQSVITRKETSSTKMK